MAEERRAPWLERRGVEPALAGALVLLSFALRVLHVLDLRASPLFDAPVMDELFHVEWARAFAAGERFQDGPFFRAPLYPWFLGVQLALFGDGLLLPRLVQCALGALSSWLVYRLGRAAFGAAAGLFAGLAHATLWALIFHDGQLLLESLFVPLCLAALLASMPLTQRLSRRRAFAAGLLWGLSAIARPTSLLFLPLFALGLVAAHRRTFRAALAGTCLLAAGTLAPIAPVTVLNALSGDLVVISTQAGVNLWIGNNPRSDGSTAIVPGTRADWWGGYRDSIALAEAAEGRPVRASEVSRHYARRALDFARREPAAWARLMLRKLRLLALDWELGNNEEPRFLAWRFSPWMRFLPLSFGSLAALAALGLLLDRRQAAARLPLWGFLLAYSAGVVLFFVNSRYRLPLVPVLAVYAGSALAWLLACLRARRWPSFAAAAAGVALLAWCLRLGRGELEHRSEANGWLILAQAEARAGRQPEALALFERSLAVDASSWVAWRGQGTTLLVLGRRPQAEAAFRAALRLSPGDLDSLYGLFDVLLLGGDLDEAGEIAESMRVLAPHLARGSYALGRVALQRGDAPGAAAHFEEALRREAADFSAAYSLGVVRDLLQDREAALRAYERARSAVAGPNAVPIEQVFVVDLYERLVSRHQESGRGDLARARAEELARLWPDHPAARALLERTAP